MLKSLLHAKSFFLFQEAPSEQNSVKFRQTLKNKLESEFHHFIVNVSEMSSIYIIYLWIVDIYSEINQHLTEKYLKCINGFFFACTVVFPVFYNTYECTPKCAIPNRVSHPTEQRDPYTHMKKHNKNCPLPTPARKLCISVE